MCPAIRRRRYRLLTGSCSYERAVDYCLSLGLENAFIQKMDSAKREYTPVFDGKCD